VLNHRMLGEWFLFAVAAAAAVAGHNGEDEHESDRSDDQDLDSDLEFVPFSLQFPEGRLLLRVRVVFAVVSRIVPIRLVFLIVAVLIPTGLAVLSGLSLPLFLLFALDRFFLFRLFLLR